MLPCHIFGFWNLSVFDQFNNSFFTLNLLDPQELYFEMSEPTLAMLDPLKLPLELERAFHLETEMPTWKLCWNPSWEWQLGFTSCFTHDNVRHGCFWISLCCLWDLRLFQHLSFILMKPFFFWIFQSSFLGSSLLMLWYLLWIMTMQKEIKEKSTQPQKKAEVVGMFFSEFPRFQLYFQKQN